jgi:AraC-like DNA-binding protein
MAFEIPQVERRLIAWVKQNAEGRDIPFHRHSRGQLTGALQGLISVGTERGRWVISAIHAVWIPPHSGHSMCSLGAFKGWSVFIDEACCRTLPDQPCILAVSGLLREAAARASTWADGPVGLGPHHLIEVIFDEIRTAPRALFGLPLPTDKRLLKITTAIAEDPADNRNLEHWAAWAGISTRTLSRRISEETGLSFTQWRQQARVLRALELLGAGMPVTTVALDMGYETVSAFTAMFRRVIGVTPTSYAVASKRDGAPDRGRLAKSA